MFGTIESMQWHSVNLEQGMKGAVVTSLAGFTDEQYPICVYSVSRMKRELITNARRTQERQCFNLSFI
jgi:hypothetical protein